MVTYLLFPREYEDFTLGLSEASSAEARLRVANRADDFGLIAQHVLEEFGLHEASPDDLLVEESFRQMHQSGSRETAPTEHNYLRLPYVGSIVAEFENETHARAALGQIELVGEVDVVPDIRLALPESVTLSATNETFDEPSRAWPGESGIASAHRASVRGNGVLVGVLDTGCDADHFEHASRSQSFYYVPLSLQGARKVRGFDPSGHGTHVCGIIAGSRIGVAPEVELLVASVIESETINTSLRRVITGLNTFLRIFSQPENANRPALINMSLGFLDSWLSPTELILVRIVLRRLFTTLVQRLGVLPIVAIGNDRAGQVRAPGYFPEALSVGAVDYSTQPVHFSGGGTSPLSGATEPDIAGYGVDVLSSYERDWSGASFYRRESGTSMATPYVTGIAALYASRDPQLKGAALRNRLIATALPLNHPQNRVGVGLARFV